MNLFDAEVLETGPHHTAVRLRSGDIVRADVDVRPARPGDNVTLGVRPEHFDPRRTSNVLQIKVRFVEPLGSVTVAYGALVGSETEVIVQLAGELLVRSGETLQLGIEPRACHVFDRNGRAFQRLGERGQAARRPAAAQA
jgi:multiple sugar transport system ATP-binding protein